MQGFAVYLFLSYRMKNSMDISSHAFSITTYVKISTISDDIPELRGLQTIII